MEMVKAYHEIVTKQINLAEKYLNMVREIDEFEKMLAGQVSQADLLMNNIIERSIDLTDDQIIGEQKELYRKVYVKKYSQMLLKNNQLFKNVFTGRTEPEIADRINSFLEYNTQMLEEENHLIKIMKLMDGEQNGTEDGAEN